MKPSWYSGPADGKSGLAPPVNGINDGYAEPGFAAGAPPAGAPGAAGLVNPHALSKGSAAPPATVNRKARRLLECCNIASFLNRRDEAASGLQGDRGPFGRGVVRVTLAAP